MRVIGLLAATALALAAPALAAPKPAAVYRNPVLPADYSDPDVIRVSDTYYLVASSFHFSPGVPILTSKDLVHWTIAGHVLPKLPFAPEYDLPGPVPTDDAGKRTPRDQRTSGQRYAGGVWAPSIRHHEGKFYVYFATPYEGIFMSTATKVEGPWTPPVAVIAGPNFEDPCPFWDDDGQAYLVHGKVGAGPLVLHRMAPDGKSVLDEGKVIIEDPKALPVLEGPKLYKRNGWYYIFAPIGGVDTGPQAVMRSRSIWGPYEHREVLVPGNGLKGPHQGGWIETPSGQGWFVHFNGEGAYGRIVHLQPVTWKDDWPFMGEPIPGAGPDAQGGRPVLEHAVPDVGGRFPAVSPQTSDGFSRAKLGPQWEWNHNPDDRRWSLTARPGFLRLTGGPAVNLVSARNTLTQALQARSVVITTRLDTKGLVDGQRAGLAMFGAGIGAIGAIRKDGQTRIVFSLRGVDTLGPVMPAGAVDLRVSVADQAANYSYSRDGGKTFVDMGGGILPRFSWWKGARPALYSYGAPGETKLGVADFDWIDVKSVAR